MNLDYYEIIVTDRSLVQKSILSSSAGEPAVLSGEFDLLDNGGCNELAFTIAREKLQGTIQVGYLVTVKAKTMVAALTTYWSGVITSVPLAGNTNREWQYRARGLFHEELSKQRIVKYYEGQDIDDLVIDILADVDTPITAISASTSEISVGSPYTVADYEVEFESAAEIVAQLAILQDDVQYGVDQNKKLYFKDVSSSNVAQYWVGTHVASLSVEEDVDDLVNDVYMQSKQVVGGGQLTLHREDATSKTAYGTKTRVVQMRNSKAAADIGRYGDSIISRQKDPKKIVEAELPTFSDFLFPRGNARITDTDAAVYSFPIRRVVYTLDPIAGLVGRMEIGDKLLGTLEEQYREVVNRIERANSNSISLSKIEHTRGEEFAQAAQVDARKNGYLNTFFDPLYDTNAFDKTRSEHVELRDRALWANHDYSYLVALSNTIPTGDEADLVRLHTDLDLRGRVSFERDDDISTFFEGGPSESFRTSPDGHGVEQYAIAGGIMFYKDQSADVPTGQVGFGLPGSYTTRVALDWVATSMSGASAVVFAFVDASNRCIVDFQNNAANMRFRLFTVVAGVSTLRETINLTKDTNYVLECIYNSSATTIQMIIRNEADDTALGTSATYTFSVAASTRKTGLAQFFNAVDGSTFRVRWFDLVLPGQGVDFTLYRGTTFPPSGNVGNTITAQGISHTNVNITALDNGENIWVKINLVHPCRVYGWGVSW